MTCFYKNISKSGERRVKKTQEWH